MSYLSQHPTPSETTAWQETLAKQPRWCEDCGVHLLPNAYARLCPVCQPTVPEPRQAAE